MILSGSVSALNDAYITIDSQGAGICLGADSINIAACHNDTLTLSGESDHFIYILPGEEVPSNATMKTKLTYMFVTSGEFIVGNFAYALVFILMILTAALFMVILARRFIIGGRR